MKSKYFITSDGESAIYNVKVSKSPRTEITKKGKTKYFYRITFYVNGSKGRKDAKGPRADTPGKALKLAKEKAKELEYGIDDSPRKLTLTELSVKYMDDMVGNKRKGITSKETRVSRMRSLFGSGAYEYTPVYIKKMRAEDLGKEEIQRWLGHIKSIYNQSNLSGSHYNNLKGSIKALIEYGADIGAFTPDQLDNVTAVLARENNVISKEEPHDYTVLTEEQFLKSLTYLKYFDESFCNLNAMEVAENVTQHSDYYRNMIYYMLFTTLFYTGMRVAESRPLLISDVTFNDTSDKSLCMININKSQSGKSLPGMRDQFHDGVSLKTKTQTSTRIAKLEGINSEKMRVYFEYMELIYEMSDTPEDKRYLFPSPKTGSRISDNAIDNMLKNCLAIIEDEVPHASKKVFRTSYATELLSRGVERDVVKTGMGHSSESIINTYYDKTRPIDRFNVANKKSQNVFHEDKRLEENMQIPENDDSNLNIEELLKKYNIKEEKDLLHEVDGIPEYIDMPSLTLAKIRRYFSSKENQ